MEESCGAVTTLPTRGPSRNSASAPDARLDLVVTRLELLQCLLIAAPFADEDFAELDVVERKKGTWGNIEVETLPSANLLLSLQGAPNVSGPRELVSAWDGSEVDGPALIISHFTNIQELTEFSVYEGEALVLDPERDNRVLGYLRLKTASPDVGHFSIADQTAIYNDDGTMNTKAAVVVPESERRSTEN